MNKFTKQCVAAFASLAMAGTLCVAGAVVANNIAFANSPSAESAKPAPWSEAGKKLTGSITITKYKDETDEKGNQKKATPVKGAKFKVYKVTNFDLTKYDQWLDVAAKVPTLNANPNDSSAGLSFDNETENPTNDNGVAKFDKLGIGLYKVEETSVPDGYEKLPQPFFMTIPQITNESGKTTYTYDVKVDPKNAYTKDAIKKTVDTTGMVGTKDDLPYTISTSVVTTSGTPVKDRTTDDYQGFAVWDDALKSAYDSNKDVVKSVKIGTTEIKNSTGKEDRYKVAVAATPGDNTRQRITVSFTDAGLGEIANALKTSPNAKLTVELKFTLKADAPAGELVNKYGYQPGYKKGTPVKDQPKPVNPTPNPDSKVTLVKFQIKKISSTDGKAIKGAKFAVFAKKTEADACAADASRSTDKCKNKSSKGFATDTETADTGLTAAGFKAKVGQKFYVVETKAPDNYVLAPKVEEVTIPTTYTSAAGYDKNSQTFVYSFKDVPTSNNIDHWFKLPKTGAYGVFIFAIAGIVLIAASVFIYTRNNRKEEDKKRA
ncbi:SpaH/EbpB family LPXTG-anchored major pilin [Gardnerella swidsinskii]|uniref:SpaH/EbpB family LPXTG-anchored major pilin n=1 Tax=Gardnerella TaxID=2701 RepID=UPI000E2EB7B8|nr:SpaH/EbpB family LPXTG-anchored major pilin [Gardnerella swidsinskii]MDK7093666.1 SpaH/EbpB family LPXTG-anchored major pilin [Gardnerella swidsinskii]NSX39254.1 SpaH/EbpB family LPXTG-anchored major pilin [Gardnerella vaginalis]